MMGVDETLNDLVKKLPLTDVPEPVQPWVQAYAAQPKLFLGDLLALLLAAGLNPFAAFPYVLCFLAAAQPLGAYSEDATSDYGKVLPTLAAAYGASTVGGLLLSAPFGFDAFGAVGKLLVSALFLSAPRAFFVYQSTGELPELSFDLDATLDKNAQQFEGKFGTDVPPSSSPPPPSEGPPKA